MGRSTCHPSVKSITAFVPVTSPKVLKLLSVIYETQVLDEKTFTQPTTEPKSSLPCSKGLSTRSYPEPDESTPIISNDLGLFNIHHITSLIKLHNEELHNWYSSPNIIRMIKSRRMRWAGHVARMGETRNAYRILV
jgi:hypothetical protein